MAEGKSRYGKKEYRALEEYSVNVEKVVLNRDFVQHSHDFDEIVLILSGTGEHLVGSQVYSLKRRDVFVIKGDTCHGFRRARELSMVNVMYDSSLLFAQSDRLRQVAGFAYLFMVQPEIHLQEPVYLEFLDEFIVREAQLDLVKDQDTDVFLLDGLMGQHLAVNIARRFRKPMCSVGCCTSTDVTACLRAASFEAYGSIDLEGTLPVMKLLQCFTEDQWGATMRYHYNRDMGETVTMVRFNPQGTRLLAAKGVIVTETDYDKIGCDTGLLVSVANKGKFFKAQCNYGHHMTWAYGDIADQLEDLGDMLGFQVERV